MPRSKKSQTRWARPTPGRSASGCLTHASRSSENSLGVVRLMHGVVTVLSSRLGRRRQQEGRLELKQFLGANARLSSTKEGQPNHIPLRGVSGRKISTIGPTHRLVDPLAIIGLNAKFCAIRDRLPWPAGWPANANGRKERDTASRELSPPWARGWIWLSLPIRPVARLGTTDAPTIVVVRCRTVDSFRWMHSHSPVSYKHRTRTTCRQRLARSTRQIDMLHHVDFTGRPHAMVCSMLGGMADRPITTAAAARVLGVAPPNLRRWIREGKFDHIEAGLDWDRGPGFKKQHIYSPEWIERVAAEMHIVPDWTALDADRN